MRNALMVVIGLVASACLEVHGQGPGSSVEARSSAPTVAARFADLQDQDRQFMAMLKARKFRELDEAFVSVIQRYQADPLTENQMDVASRAFNRAGADLQPLLDAWIAEMPRSYAALLARGVFYSAVGWSKRGTCLAGETSCNQFAAMREYHAKASKDLDAALALNPRLMHALIYKMDIAMAAGDRAANQKLYGQALQLNPLSLTARFWRMTALLPRWGGSMKELQAEIAAARPHYAKNPALKVLEGKVALERGDDAFFADDFPAAVRLYGEALRSGSHPFYHRKRAEAMMKIDAQFTSAGPDLDAALKVAPNEYRARFLRGFLRQDQNDLKGALEDLNLALEGDPRNSRAWDIRGIVHANLGDMRAALADFEKAVALEPEAAEYQQHLAMARQRLGGKP